jgi:hypothetical protein
VHDVDAVEVSASARVALTWQRFIGIAPMGNHIAAFWKLDMAVAGFEHVG